MGSNLGSCGSLTKNRGTLAPFFLLYSTNGKLRLQSWTYEISQGLRVAKTSSAIFSRTRNLTSQSMVKVVGCPPFQSPPLWLSFSIVSGLCIFTSVTFVQVDMGVVLEWFRRLSLSIFRTRGVLRLACGMAWGAHLFEAFVAYRICTRLGGGKDTWKWTIQTFCVGYPSLRLLQKGERRRAWNTW